MSRRILLCVCVAFLSSCASLGGSGNQSSASDPAKIMAARSHLKEYRASGSLLVQTPGSMVTLLDVPHLCLLPAKGKSTPALSVSVKKFGKTLFEIAPDQDLSAQGLAPDSEESRQLSGLLHSMEPYLWKVLAGLPQPGDHTPRDGLISSGTFSIRETPPLWLAYQYLSLSTEGPAYLPQKIRLEWFSSPDDRTHPVARVILSLNQSKKGDLPCAPESAVAIVPSEDESGDKNPGQPL